jgi:hypothetical protein
MEVPLLPGKALGVDRNYSLRPIWPYVYAQVVNALREMPASRPGGRFDDNARLLDGANLAGPEVMAWTIMVAEYPYARTNFQMNAIPVDWTLGVHYASTLVMAGCMLPHVCGGVGLAEREHVLREELQYFAMPGVARQAAQGGSVVCIGQLVGCNKTCAGITSGSIHGASGGLAQKTVKWRRDEVFFCSPHLQLAEQL